MNNKGISLLKSSSIGLIIIGILGVILYGLMTAIIDMGIVASGYDSTKGSIVALICILYTVMSIFAIVTGVYGVKKGSDPKNAKTCLVLGIITLLLYCAADLWMSTGQDTTIAHDIYSIVTHVVPSFYVWGAYYMTNRKW